MRNIVKHILFVLLSLFSITKLHSGFISFHLLRHEYTGQQLILLGDKHNIQRYPNKNRVAIINLAHTINAHIIVEDMSDTSMIDAHCNEHAGFNIIAARCTYTDMRAAYCSLSLTHHCRRKKIPITNVEFRHFTCVEDPKQGATIISKDAFSSLIKNLYNNLSPAIYPYIDELHQPCLDWAALLNEAESLSENGFVNKMILDNADLSQILPYRYPYFDLFLDILILNSIYTISQRDALQPIIICAGDAHIGWLLPMLEAMGYYHEQHIDYDQFNHAPELRLRKIFKKQVLQKQKLHKRITCRGMRWKDKMRVGWAYMTSGAALSALASIAASLLYTGYHLQST